jgi:hypothetical protein
MKRNTWLIMIFALFLVGSTATVGQTSPAEITTFYSYDSFNPFGGVGTVENFPTITCPGGELLAPPPDPWENPCTEGSRVHTRGYTITTVFHDATDPRVNGTATIEVNANFDADGNGPAWGTISIEIAGGLGTWSGVWEGIRVKEGDVWVIPVHASLRGTEGSVEGLLYRAVDTVFSPYFVVVAYEGEIEGSILDPHKK